MLRQVSQFEQSSSFSGCISSYNVINVIYFLFIFYISNTKGNEFY